MFTIFTILAVLIALLPVSSGAYAHEAPRNLHAQAKLQMKNFPTPTGIEKAVNQIAQNQIAGYKTNNVSEQENHTGHTVSGYVQSQVNSGDNNDPVEAEAAIPDNKFYPTPTWHPLPIVTDIPSSDLLPRPTPISFDPKPTIEPGGCPPPCKVGMSKCIEMPCMY